MFTFLLQCFETFFFEFVVVRITLRWCASDNFFECVATMRDTIKLFKIFLNYSRWSLTEEFFVLNFGILTFHEPFYALFSH